MILGSTGPDIPRCSRAGCRSDADWALDWSNPRIHTDGRTKTWLACDEHVDYLEGFLGSRSFPVTRRRFGEAVTG